jgi:MFS family permease
MVNATCYAFQTPAYMATITLLVPKKHLSRASGMVDIAEAVGYILAPTMAGSLILRIGVDGVILIDFVTFLCALVTLVSVKFPKPNKSDLGQKAEEAAGWLEKLSFGWSYIRARRGLFSLLMFFGAFNFVYRMVTLLIVPLVLSFTTADVLGDIGSTSAVGFLAGGLVMGIWGGPTRRAMGVLVFAGFSAFGALMIGLRPDPFYIVAGVSLFLFCFVVANGCNRAFWQFKVEPDIQGRVFSVQTMLAQASQPIASILVGPLADQIFEPFIQSDTPLAGFARNIVGAGDGRGIGLMFVVMAGLLVFIACMGFLYPSLRQIDNGIPDVIGEKQHVRTN